MEKPKLKNQILIKKYKGTDGKLHDLVRKKVEDTMHPSLEELVRMNKPRERKEYETKSYSPTGSVLRYYRMSSGRMEERDEKIRDKKYLWRLLFANEDDIGLYLVPEHEIINQWKDKQTIPNTYIPLTKYADGSWSGFNATNLKQKQFDEMGIDPKQFVIPKSSKLTDFLTHTLERMEKDRMEKITK